MRGYHGRKAQHILREEIKWQITPCRYQDEVQEYYAKQIGWHTAGMQMSDIYSVWSATNIVHMMSEHTRDPKEMQKYLGLGQKARFWYGQRPKNDKEESYRDADLGVMIELHKQLTSMHKWKTKEAPAEGDQLMQRVAHMDHLIDEIIRLLPKLPPLKDMGI